ncbi:hypothetical protein [uncultured Chryseobacterium sp.]|nr:hypothetical protein [uncultured Chryseobacterium sp.]
MGISEKTIGKFLKSTNKKIFIATKLEHRCDAPTLLL